MSDQNNAVLDALNASTKAATQQTRRLDTLETRLNTLEATLDARMGRLEQEMGTMNAYLDNLVRETQTTNDLLRQDQDMRRTEVQRKVDAEAAEQKRKDDEIAHQRVLEMDTRATYQKMAAAIWSTFKQPLAYLATAVVGWIILHWLNLQIPVGQQ